MNVPLEYEGFEDWLANLLDADEVNVGEDKTDTISTTFNADILPTTNASMVDTTPLSSEANNMAAAGQVSASFAMLVICLSSWKLLISQK